MTKQNTSNIALRFCDDPMFKRVMEKQEICKGVIERIIGRPVKHVRYHNTEQEKRISPSGKTIRMDAYLVETEGHVYDIEMQVTHNPLLPMRFRGYQSILDASFLKESIDYSELRGSYVIFICMHDPFGHGLPVYTIERTCLEDKNVECNCHAHWIALNASAWDKLGANSSLGLLLKYICTNEIAEGDNLIQDIDACVVQNNTDKEWVMTMIDSISIAEEEALIRGRMEGRAEGEVLGEARGRKAGITEGRKAGIAEGRAEGLRYEKLVDALLSARRFDDLQRASSDQTFRQKLFSEFGL